MAVAFCIVCKGAKEHRHMHDTAHGIDGTHMAGSERYECVHCGNTIKPHDAKPYNEHLSFVLDREKCR